jgi:hypothetical protein
MMFALALGLACGYLWRTLEGTHGEVGSGERMPKDGTLPAASRGRVRAWIAGGAPR